MKFWTKFLTILITAACIAVSSLAASINKDLQQINYELDQISNDLRLMGEALDKAEELAIQKSLPFAPPGKTIFVLRGDAQKRAQNVLDQMTEHYGLPQYTLPGIRFTPSLDNNAAGTATHCDDAEGVYLISLNEILYLRNYNEFMSWVIPHEVAHVVTCMLGGFEQTGDQTINQAAHQEEWLEVMRDMGFENPEQLRTHGFDNTPVEEYRKDVEKRLEIVVRSGKSTLFRPNFLDIPK